MLFDPATTNDVVHGSEVLKLDCVRKYVRPVHLEKKPNDDRLHTMPADKMLLTWI